MAERVQVPFPTRKVILHNCLCNELNQIYTQKNNDYGDSFGKSIKDLGIIAAVTRIYDKMQRIISLTKKDATRLVTDETLKDTLMDMANYCIMTVIELGGVDDATADRVARVPKEYPDLPGEHTECDEPESRGVHTK